MRRRASDARGAEAPHPGGPAHALALRGLPPARRPGRAPRCRRDGPRSSAPTASPSGSACARCGSRTRRRTRRTRSRTASSPSRSPRALELGFDTVACASTGNLAGAVAAHAAAAGLPAYVFVPADLEPEKILSAGAYGARILGVRGNYDDVNRLCTEVSGERESWAFVNVNVRPYYAEGSKTLAFETAEQLGWELPDRVVAPIASGSLFTKVARGFQEWIDAGLLGGRPARHARRPGGRLLARRAGLRRRARTSAGPSSRTRSPSRWPSATRPTGRTPSTSRAGPAARSRPSPTTRSAPASACSPRRPASSPRRPAA